jgi:hypothetical protein
MLSKLLAEFIEKPFTSQYSARRKGERAGAHAGLAALSGPLFRAGSARSTAPDRLAAPLELKLPPLQPVAVEARRAERSLA